MITPLTIPITIRRNDPSALPRFAALNAKWIEERNMMTDVMN